MVQVVNARVVVKGVSIKWIRSLGFIDQYIVSVFWAKALGECSASQKPRNLFVIIPFVLFNFVSNRNRYTVSCSILPSIGRCTSHM